MDARYARYRRTYLEETVITGSDITSVIFQITSGDVVIDGFKFNSS